MYIQIINLTFAVARLIQYYNACRWQNQFCHICAMTPMANYVSFSHPFIKNIVCASFDLWLKDHSTCILHFRCSFLIVLIMWSSISHSRHKEKNKGPFAPTGILDHLPTFHGDFEEDDGRHRDAGEFFRYLFLSLTQSIINVLLSYVMSSQVYLFVSK